MASYLRNAFLVDAIQWENINDPPADINLLAPDWGGLEGWMVYLGDWVVRDLTTGVVIDVVSAGDFPDKYTAA